MERTTVDIRGVEIEMIFIPGDTFTMGNCDERGEPHEYPPHFVEFDGFWIQETLVTQELWQVIRRLPIVEIDLPADPSEYKGHDRPVESVTHIQVREAAARVGRYTNLPFRLLSEAEWEIACRGGTSTPFHTGYELTPSQANFHTTMPLKSKYRKRLATTEVKLYPPNGYGLYDMHGNVEEWCSNHYYRYEKGYRHNSTPVTPVEQKGIVYYAARGGSYLSSPESCRVTSRTAYVSDIRYDDLGFRLGMSAPKTLS